MKIRFSASISNDYDSRCVFNGGDWPLVPDGPGLHDIPRETVLAVRDDAQHNGNVDGDGPDCMPPGLRRAYAALYRQCQRVLSEVVQ